MFGTKEMNYGRKWWQSRQRQKGTKEKTQDDPKGKKEAEKRGEKEIRLNFL